MAAPWSAEEAPEPSAGAFREGAQGYLLTALRGREVERIPVSYIGVYEDFLGPGYDIHLVRLEGAVADHVGVAAGMSGSPVYIEDRLIGALAYRFGVLPKDAIAGVTPIEAIREAARSAATPAPESDLARPIATPLSASGLHPALREWAREQFESIGMVWTEGVVASGGEASGRQGFVPGSPIGVTLVRGDWSFAATGTVTTVEDRTVYAFGHPFLGVGAVDLPMHAASVVHTLADETGSVKLASIGEELGTITDDRLTAIVGRLDQRSELIPLVVHVNSGEATREHRVEIVDVPVLTPLLAGISVSNAIVNRIDNEQAMTVFASGTIRLSGRPDLPFELVASGEGPAPMRSIAATVQNTMTMLWNNPFEKPDVSGIEVDVTVIPGVKRYLLESLYYDRKTARPGENIHVTASLRPLRGDPIRREFELRLPHGIADGSRLRLAVGPQDQVERALGNPLRLRLRSSNDLSGVIHVMGELKSDHRLIAVLFDDAPTVVRDGLEFSRLPSTAVHLLSTGARAGAASRVRVSRLSTTQVELDGPVYGGLTINVLVEAGGSSSPSSSEESP